MRITIDTERDSKESLQHVMRLLEQVAGQSGALAQSTISPAAQMCEPSTSNPFATMFGDSAPSFTSSSTESADNAIVSLFANDPALQINTAQKSEETDPLAELFGPNIRQDFDPFKDPLDLLPKDDRPRVSPEKPKLNARIEFY